MLNLGAAPDAKDQARRVLDFFSSSLFVIPDDAPENHRRSRLAYEALRGTGVDTDVVIWRRTRFQQREQLKSSLSATVLYEGKLLYAA